MSGIEHFDEDLAAIEREIARCAQFCGFDIHDDAAVERLLHEAGRPAHTREEQYRQRMIGLIVMRARILKARAEGGA